MEKQRYACDEKGTYQYASVVNTTLEISAIGSSNSKVPTLIDHIIKRVSKNTSAIGVRRLEHVSSAVSYIPFKHVIF